MPKGNISIAHTDKSCKWFYSYDNKQVYLKKSEIELARQLAVKKYLGCKIDYLESKLRHIESSSIKLNESETRLNKLLADNAYCDLLDGYLSSYPLEASHWMKQDYPKSTKHPETLTHSTIGGLMVRSKSESMIALALSEHKIPFRYENLITIGDITLSPDFTTLHPFTNKIIYWEHFGLIENEMYFKEFIFKIKQYAKANIILGDNLIATFETKDNPLSYTTINKTINQYFN